MHIRGPGAASLTFSQPIRTYVHGNRVSDAAFQFNISVENSDTWLMSAAEDIPDDIDIPSEEPSKSTKSSRVLTDINHLEKRLAELLEQDVPGSRISFGFTVLSSVARGQYDRAIAELDSVGIGLEEYRLFEFRARRFVEHAKSLVVAIRAKHAVGKSANVNKSKQKELSDKIAEHFLDLKRTIIIIEKIQKSVRSEDLSSTILFFRTCFCSVAFVLGVYAFWNVYPDLEAFSFRDLFSFFFWEWPL